MSRNGTKDSEALQQAPSKPTFRRLVVMFDGTGSTRQNMTNVSRMFEAIDDSHPKSYKCIRHGIPDSKAENGTLFQGPACTGTVPCGKCNLPMKVEDDEWKPYFCAGFPCDSCHQFLVEPELQPLQLVKYITGVGTVGKGPVGWLRAQSLDYDLSDKIKEGYTWLCQNYQSTEDEVFVFGFSQGAFAARSLVSLLQRCDGVFKKPKSEDPDLAGAIEKAYGFYKECEKSTDKYNEYLEKHEIRIERLPVRVKMLGLWDTVSAAGLPESGYSWIDNRSFSRAQYKFHEYGLPCIVENAYHALALDEHRAMFKPTLWTSRASTGQEVKQVWFVGSHSNVGGGADLDDVADPDDLWQYSYVWMQRHAEKHGLRFYWSFDYPATRQGNLRTRRVSLREPESSWKNIILWLYSSFDKQNPFIRETDPKLAMLHWSVIERLNVTKYDLDVHKRDLGGNSWKLYRPASLLGNHDSDDAKNDACAKFLAKVIDEGRTEVMASHHGDVRGIREEAAPKWHVETDDVMKDTPWALEVLEEDGKGGKAIDDKKVE